MPNRILREGILTSDRVEKLSDGAEVFYRRLMSVVDDYGRFDARPMLLMTGCYPLRADVMKPASIAHWIKECVDAGLIRLYEVKGKPYLELLDFRQQTRTKEKYPAPQCDSDPPSTREQPATQTDSRPLAGCELRVRAGEDGVGVGVGVEGGVGVDKPLALPADVGIRPEVWAAWTRHRGKKLTPEAIRLQLKHLAEWRAQGHDPNDIIERSIANGWTGLFAPKEGDARTRPRQRDPTPAERKAANVTEIIRDARHDRAAAIDSTAQRVDREAVPALPGHIRQSR